jgi:hypothetical protein
MLETPYIGAQYRPRMFAPQATAPSIMTPPQYGRMPTAQMFQPPPMTLPNIGGGQGGTVHGGGGGSGGAPGGPPQATPDMDWGNDDGLTPEQGGGSEWSYDSLGDFASANGLNFGAAGSGGMLERLNNMMSKTPGGMLATMLGKPLAGLAPFKTSSIGTGYSTNVGGSMLGPSAPPAGPSWSVPQVQSNELNSDWADMIQNALTDTTPMAGITDQTAPQEALGGMSANTYMQSLMDGEAARTGQYDKQSADTYMADLMGNQANAEDYPGLGFWDENGEWQWA